MSIVRPVVFGPTGGVTSSLDSSFGYDGGEGFSINIYVSTTGIATDPDAADGSGGTGTFMSLATLQLAHDAGTITSPDVIGFAAGTYNSTITKASAGTDAVLFPIAGVTYTNVPGDTVTISIAGLTSTVGIAVRGNDIGNSIVRQHPDGGLFQITGDASAALVDVRGAATVTSTPKFIDIDVLQNKSATSAGDAYSCTAGRYEVEGGTVSNIIADNLAASSAQCFTAHTTGSYKVTGTVCDNFRFLITNIDQTSSELNNVTATNCHATMLPVSGTGAGSSDVINGCNLQMGPLITTGLMFSSGASNVGTCTINSSTLLLDGITGNSLINGSGKYHMNNGTLTFSSATGRIDTTSSNAELVCTGVDISWATSTVPSRQMQPSASPKLRFERCSIDSSAIGSDFNMDLVRRATNAVFAADSGFFACSFIGAYHSATINFTAAQTAGVHPNFDFEQCTYVAAGTSRKLIDGTATVGPRVTNCQFSDGVIAADTGTSADGLNNGYFGTAVAGAGMTDVDAVAVTTEGFADKAGGDYDIDLAISDLFEAGAGTPTITDRENRAFKSPPAIGAYEGY